MKLKEETISKNGLTSKWAVVELKPDENNVQVRTMGKIFSLRIFATETILEIQDHRKSPITIEFE